MGTIWTIGHSTRSFSEFADMLTSFDIEVLVDVRAHPGSRKHPHFSKDSLSTSLPDIGIDYAHLVDLGGRRKPDPQSPHVKWRHPSFRAYADHMQTVKFLDGMRRLEGTAGESKVCYMCSEAVWWKCHRSMISDFLKSRSWDVQHIMAAGTTRAHRYTSPADVCGGTLTYL